jgi:ribosomal protein S18 acetylase RimI-like enzyme
VTPHQGDDRRASMSTRIAGPADLDAIVPLMIDFNAVEQIEWRPEPMTAALSRLLAEPALGFVLLAIPEAGAPPAGYGIATMGFDLEFGGPDAFVTELYVAAAHRGRGVGRALLVELMEELARRGASAVQLMVRPENAAARALYTRLGFTDVPRLVMARPLGPETPRP